LGQALMLCSPVTSAHTVAVDVGYPERPMHIINNCEYYMFYTGGGRRYWRVATGIYRYYNR
jgi:hypothetical protein